MVRPLEPDAGRDGSGTASAGSDGQPRAAGIPSRASVSTVTNEGQSPPRHERSWLQDDAWIRVFGPSSVSTRWSDMQLVSAPQCPQPSQTSSLITTKRFDAGSCPRFWRRRRSLAQMPVVDQHGHAARRRELPQHRVLPLDDLHARVPASSAPRYASGSLVRTTVVRTPSSSSIRVSSGTGFPPTISWAPVFATNPL